MFWFVVVWKFEFVCVTATLCVCLQPKISVVNFRDSPQHWKVGPLPLDK